MQSGECRLRRDVDLAHRDCQVRPRKTACKCSKKMAAAVRVLGWPEEIVHASRAQMQSITKMQWRSGVRRRRSK